MYRNSITSAADSHALAIPRLADLSRALAAAYAGHGHRPGPDAATPGKVPANAARILHALLTFLADNHCIKPDAFRTFVCPSVSRLANMAALTDSAVRTARDWLLRAGVADDHGFTWGKRLRISLNPSRVADLIKRAGTFRRQALRRDAAARLDTETTNLGDNPPHQSGRGIWGKWKLQPLGDAAVKSQTKKDLGKPKAKPNNKARAASVVPEELRQHRVVAWMQVNGIAWRQNDTEWLSRLDAAGAGQARLTAALPTAQAQRKAAGTDMPIPLGLLARIAIEDQRRSGSAPASVRPGVRSAAEQRLQDEHNFVTRQRLDAQDAAQWNPAAYLAHRAAVFAAAGLRERRPMTH